MRKLGKVQQDVLDSLRLHGAWSPDARCGWVWDSMSNTQRIMDSLVVRGVVKRCVVQDTRRPGNTRVEYRPIRANASDPDC
jgi:hypothetical protein